jgi:hypothetical protein
VSGADGLGYSPRAAGGDRFPEDAADGAMNATAGPSCRMVAALGTVGVSAEGVYPGGQSENPASPWYADLVAFVAGVAAGLLPLWILALRGLRRAPPPVRSPRAGGQAQPAISDARRMRSAAS